MINTIIKVQDEVVEIDPSYEIINKETRTDDLGNSFDFYSKEIVRKSELEATIESLNGHIEQINAQKKIVQEKLDAILSITE